MRLSLGLKICTIMLSVQGCAFIRNIPANSTPQREARYLRTNDVGNFAVGAGCNAIVGLVEHGKSAWWPVVRTATCATGSILQRSIDKGYRESGAMFQVSGSWTLEIFRIVSKLF